MKTKTVSSFFLLSVLVAGMIAATPSASADHPNVVIEPLPGSSTAGCQDTEEGCYNMPVMTVSPGTEITFSNTDTVAHVMTEGTVNNEDGYEPMFDSSLVFAGATYTFTLEEEGTYNHFCIVHPWMTGQIIVDAAHGEEATTTDEPGMDDMDEPGMDDMDEPGMDDMDEPGMDDMDEPGMDDMDEPGMDDMDEPGMDDMDEPGMDDMDEPGMDDMDEPGMDDTTTTTTTGDDGNGGCLIATAAYGSELAPQVQQLRELRDNTVLATASGTAFMSGFNQLYYTFSPTVADLERENPVFREAVQITLTPMLSSLSLLNYAEIDTEAEMLGYGVSVLLLNLGMYVGIPAFAILKCTKLVRARLTEKPQNR